MNLVIKIIPLYIFVTLSGLASAQTKAPDKIIINYTKGNSWGDPGKAYSRSELFEISPNKRSHYFISKYQVITSRRGENGKSFITDTVALSFKQRLTSKKIIDSLRYALNHNQNNFTVGFIRSRLTAAPTKKMISNIGKELDPNFTLKGEDADLDNVSISKLINFNKFAQFIDLKRPDPNTDVVVLDAHNSMTIAVIYKNDTVLYKSQFISNGVFLDKGILGQPFKTLKPSANKGVVNLNINYLLDKILPLKSELKKKIGLNSIVASYVRWYIDKGIR